ncbi:hypothetical protein ABT56_16935 [Photobacterium aquae]|uniref:Acyltransferase 3 domain-containing protein n=1 Tax=Photobacterium aquae TaxID=1195763 RepID=A0A0J1GW35_9GAMM|nr:acyltransferase family protein [Photobacterium aquae]KLV03918.1 hypothetical protein ABT56_16935 [Photobacterium aquae]
MNKEYRITMNNRLSWADSCRILATLGVIIIHACVGNFSKFGTIPTYEWLSVNLLDSLVRVSVPLFFMLSGAFILKTDGSYISLKSVFKRTARIAIPLFVWSIGYLAYISHYTGQGIDVLSVFKKPSMYHLWFVYSLIGVYLLLPLLQSIFNALVSRKDYQIYFLVLWFTINCLPTFIYMPEINLMHLTGFLGHAGYFLIGGLLFSYLSSHKELGKPQTMLTFIVFVGALASTFLITWFISDKANRPLETAYSNFCPTIFIASVSLFVLFSQLKTKEKTAKVLNWISDRTFIIYFVHVLVLEKVTHFVTGHIHLPAMISIISISLITFTICLVIAAILRLLPKSKMILG